jgi:DNA-binding winged helix-turn-helix (wHTH) protein/Tfp pilus assembly protein PilF
VVRIEPIVAEAGRSNLQEVVKRYAFGPFVLDARLQVLSAGGEPLALGPRVVATLGALIERAGEVVTKDEILDRVWAGEDVGESNVAQSVYTLRKVLRDHGVTGAIATIPRRGYRFTAPVELLAGAPHPAIPIRYERAAPPRRRGRWTLAALSLALVLLAGVPPTATVAHPPPLGARGAEMYRLGRYFWNLRTPAGLAAGARLFADVVASDPRSPLGHAGLADANLMFADYGKDKRKASKYYARARTEIAAALALDRDSAAAHTSLAMLRFAANHDAAGSDAEFRRAIELDPSYAVAHHWFGTTLLQRGRIADAKRELRVAVALEPVSPATGGWLADASYYRGEYTDAIVYARRALDLDPHRGGALRRLGLAYELAGDVPQAIATFERLRRSGPDADGAPALLAEAYARAGRLNAARRALRDAVRLHPREGDTAFAMLALGDRTGLAILEHTMTSMARMHEAQELHDPRFAPFRDELRQRAQRRRT